MMERFAFPVSKAAFDLIDRGFMYICGRDRFYRPIMCMKYHVLHEMPTMPEADDVIGAALVTILFLKKYMWEDGVVENHL
jgi:hypothetical protein